ncbi:hypothetical protein HPB49_007487 [Dermacentor silvarum]|uniref:Uncharacterized protein n=1 Tax=Dermacentor silvarum TaxID=543639 RepID=A0ACB8DI19_DERSI|nr:hypothetical protein HPB49_007487 [Dermacentor silvarum]
MLTDNVLNRCTAGTAEFLRGSVTTKNEEPSATGSGVRSFLWSTRSEPPSYFFGTIHVPYTRVWDHVPENAKRAFGNADRVVFELDLLDPGTLGALANCQLLPEGRSLADVLPADLLTRLRRHLEYVRAKMSSWMTSDQRGRGLYADYLFHAITGDWERKRPIWVLLMVDSLTEGDVRARGVPVLDLFLAQEAQRLAKRTGAVEQVHEQCLPLNGLNGSQVLFALDQTLRQHERIRRGAQRSGYGADDLIRHYNCGDLDAVVFSRDTAQVPPLANTSLRLSARELRLARDIDRYFRHELIYKRNHRMGDRVLRLLRGNPGQSFFFAFGAGHFLGNNTVLDFVRQGGFDIEHIVATRSIPEVKKDGEQESSWPDPAEVLGDQQQSAPDQAPGWRRRKAKKRPFLSSPPTTTRPRKFNDLWVRLDSTWRPRSLPAEALGARASAPGRVAQAVARTPGSGCRQHEPDDDPGRPRFLFRREHRQGLLPALSRQLKPAVPRRPLKGSATASSLPSYASVRRVPMK